MYSTETKAGIIENWFSQNQIHLSTWTVSVKTISQREAVTAQLPFRGQDFQKCLCKKNQCYTKKCAATK